MPAQENRIGSAVENKKQSITFLSEFFPDQTGAITGGVESRVYHLSKELSKKYHVDVITSYRGGPRQYTLGKVYVECVGPRYPYTNYGHTKERLVFCAHLFKKIVQIKSKNIIFDANSFLCYLPPLVFGKQVCLTYHETWVSRWIKKSNSWKGILGEIGERLVHLLVRLKRVPIIAVSHETKRMLVRHKIPSHQITVVYNGVDIAAEQSDKKEKNPTICYVGRLVREKRVHIIVQAFAELIRKIPHARLKMIGEGPEKAKLKQLAAKLNVHKSCDFEGYLPVHGKVLYELSKAHVFCSTSAEEGFGIALVEAMALGVPYVVSDLPVFKEVTQKKGGYLCKPEPGEIAEKMFLLLTDAELYIQKQKEAKERASHFAWPALAQEVEHVYNSVRF